MLTNELTSILQDIRRVAADVEAVISKSKNHNTDDEVRVLRTLSQRAVGGLNIESLANQTGFNKKYLSRLIGGLRDKGLVRQSGDRKGTKYLVVRNSVQTEAPKASERVAATVRDQRAA